MSHARKTTLILFISSPEAEIVTHPCVLHNFDILRYILVMFGRNEEEDQ